MAIIPVKIPNFQQSRRVVDSDGRPEADFLRYLNNAFQQLQNNANATNAALIAAGIATTAAAAANAAAAGAVAASTNVQAEQSIVTSFVKDFAGASPLNAATTGNVTIANHTRQYGDTVMNPDVIITGAVLATGAAAGSIVRIYYDDATRADATPTFAFTVDPADAPIQGGIRHVIGAVEIPAAGTSDGGYVRNPGYTGPIP